MCQLLPARPFFGCFFFLLFSCVHAQRPPTAVSCTIFVLTNESSKLMWKDVLIIIHLPSSYTRGLLAINHTLFFPLPPSLLLSSISIARLPAGATRLAGREVTTRGQPHVSVSESEERKADNLPRHRFLFLLFPYISRTECLRL